MCISAKFDFPYLAGRGGATGGAEGGELGGELNGAADSEAESKAGGEAGSDGEAGADRGADVGERAIKQEYPEKANSGIMPDSRRRCKGGMQ